MPSIHGNPLKKIQYLVVTICTISGLLFCISFIDSSDSSAGQAGKLIIHADGGRFTIHRNIYGHFIEHLGRCIYNGIWVGEESPIPNTRGIRNDVVGALRRLNVPVVRWPGGCFADTYHWMDGIGPKEKRPLYITDPPSVWPDEPDDPLIENNHFGTHEFLDFCEMIGAEPFITGNLGSGTVQELRQWVEYVNSNDVNPMSDLRKKNGHEKPWGVRYWGIGNESDGCGGTMRPEYYSDLFQRYSTFIQWVGDSSPFMIAAGPQFDNFEWTDVVMKNAGPGARRYRMGGLDFHYYTSIRTHLSIKPSWPSLSESATDFGEEEWFAILERATLIEELINKHDSIMSIYDPEKNISLVVGEWGTWHNVDPGTRQVFLYMENTLRDALCAGITLNILNRHCDRVRMANIAQMINVLQSVIKTKGDSMILTPTYHVFEMYKVHQDALLLPCDVECPPYRHGAQEISGVSVSASRDKTGKIHVSLCNPDPENTLYLDCELRGYTASRVSGRVLTAPAMNSHNTFRNPDNISPAEFNDFRLKHGILTLTLPAKSVVMLEMD